jgi:hypothetical protein
MVLANNEIKKIKAQLKDTVTVTELETKFEHFKIEQEQVMESKISTILFNKKIKQIEDSIGHQDVKYKTQYDQMAQQKTTVDNTLATIH